MTTGAVSPIQIGGLEAVGVQRRAVRVLVTSQILGGVGVSSGISVGALLAAQVLGREDLAGFVQSSQVLGAALLALPAARLAVTKGRRVGLAFAYGLAVAGAVLAVFAAQTRSFPLLLAGTALFGGGTTAGLQARYAATDLAAAQHRGRALSVVVWATTIGAVAGPNLVGPAGRLADSLGIVTLAGPFVIAFVALLLAAGVVSGGLRPDPLLVARSLDARARELDAELDARIREPAIGDSPAGEPGIEERPAIPATPVARSATPVARSATPVARSATPVARSATPVSERRRGVLRHGLSVAMQSPPAILALTTIAVAHTVMVSVMVMTPIHMDHGDASLELIGLVISVHVAGMYALSPIVGWLADRAGRVPVIVAGSGLLLVAVALAGTSAEGSSPTLGLGLFLLGLGWSFCLVAGSTLLTDAVPLADRPTVQGASDLLMGLCAAGGGAVAGVVVGTLGYGLLNALAGVLVFATLGVAAHPACRRASNICSA